MSFFSRAVQSAKKTIRRPTRVLTKPARAVARPVLKKLPFVKKVVPLALPGVAVNGAAAVAVKKNPRLVAELALPVLGMHTNEKVRPITLAVGTAEAAKVTAGASTKLQQLANKKGSSHPGEQSGGDQLSLQGKKQNQAGLGGFGSLTGPTLILSVVGLLFAIKGN